LPVFDDYLTAGRTTSISCFLERISNDRPKLTIIVRHQPFQQSYNCTDVEIPTYQYRYILNHTDLCIQILCIGMHTLHMRRQLILPMKSSPARILTTSTSRDLTPEVRLDGGVQGCVVSSKLGLATKGQAFAAFGGTKKLAVAEYGADCCDIFFFLGHGGSGVVRLVFVLLGVYSIRCIMKPGEERRIRMERVLHQDWIRSGDYWGGVH
jgi:hypothetical protein